MMDFKILINLLAEREEIETKLKFSDTTDDERIKLSMRKALIDLSVVPELLEHAKIMKKMIKGQQ